MEELSYVATVSGEFAKRSGDEWTATHSVSEETRTEMAELVVEVKSKKEQWSAGDVIRQLKSYARERPQHVDRTVMMLVCDAIPNEAQHLLLENERIVYATVDKLEYPWVSQ